MSDCMKTLLLLANMEKKRLKFYLALILGKNIVASL